jgi:hypothetical protein
MMNRVTDADLVHAARSRRGPSRSTVNSAVVDHGLSGRSAEPANGDVRTSREAPVALIYFMYTTP